jgi:hypothetical protein
MSDDKIKREEADPLTTVYGGVKMPEPKSDPLGALTVRVERLENSDLLQRIVQVEDLERELSTRVEKAGALVEELVKEVGDMGENEIAYERQLSSHAKRLRALEEQIRGLASVQAGQGHENDARSADDRDVQSQPEPDDGREPAQPIAGAGAADPSTPYPGASAGPATEAPIDHRTAPLTDAWDTISTPGPGEYSVKPAPKAGFTNEQREELAHQQAIASLEAWGVGPAIEGTHRSAKKAAPAPKTGEDGFFPEPGQSDDEWLLSLNPNCTHGIHPRVCVDKTDPHGRRCLWCADLAKLKKLGWTENLPEPPPVDALLYVSRMGEVAAMVERAAGKPEAENAHAAVASWLRAVAAAMGGG